MVIQKHKQKHTNNGIQDKKNSTNFSSSKRYDLCLEIKKITIPTFAQHDKILNNGSELISPCRHEKFFIPGHLLNEPKRSNKFP